MNIKNILLAVVLGLIVTGVLYLGLQKPREEVLQEEKFTVVIGDANSAKTWVYLSGLTDDFEASESSIENRMKMDAIGKEVGVRFIAVKPPRRCENHENLLCWPHDNEAEFEGSKNYLMSKVNLEEVSGMVGFSNGGYFLNRLGAYEKFGIPFISIGAGGSSPDGIYNNELYMLIGNKDEYNYDNAKAYYAKISAGNPNVSILEFEGGHEIPEKVLVELLRNF